MGSFTKITPTQTGTKQETAAKAAAPSGTFTKLSTGEIIGPQSLRDNESTYTPASTIPAYGSAQNSMTVNAGTKANPAPLGAATSAGFGVQMAKAAAPALAGRQDEIRLENLRKRAEKLEAQYRQISQDASRSRYRKYESERAEAGELWRAARDEYERAAAEMGIQTDTQWGKLAGGTVLKGINQFTSSVANTADWLVGTLTRAAFGLNHEEYESLNTPTTALKKLQQSEREGLAAAYAENAATSKAASLIDEYGTATVAALPQAILALLSGGQSEVVSSASLASTAATETGLASTVGNAVKALAKDPQFGVSFATVAGDSYEKAIEEGASGLQASSYALINGMLNSIVEVSGGTETLPKKLSEEGAESALKEWVFSAIDEGKEEVVQGVIERALENLVYGKSNPLASTTDENAVFNPGTAAKEFAGGVVVGGVLGGGQTVANKVIQGIDNVLLNRAAGELANDGSVTNRTATEILENPSARATLETEAGLSVTEDMTKSQQRAAVKSAVEGLASRANGTDTATATDTIAGQAAAQTAAQARPVAQRAYDAGRLRRAASALGENGAKALAAAYDGSVNADKFYAEFAAYYEAGVSGTDDGKVKGLYSGQLNEAQKYAAYVAGQNDAAAAREKAAESVGQDGGPRTAKNRGASPADTRKTGRRLNVDEGTVKQAVRLSEATGRRIVFYKGAAGENGYYRDGTIHVNANSKRPAAQIIAHELTHSIEGGKGYAGLSELVLRQIERQGGDLEALRRGKTELYARTGHPLESMEAVDAEIVAEYVERNLLTDEGSILALTRENRTVAQRVLDWLDGLLAKLGSGKARERVFIRQAAELYRGALEQTAGEDRQQADTERQGDDYLAQIGDRYSAGEISEAEYDRLFDEYYRGGSEAAYSISETLDGIEAYETSEEIRRMPYRQRMEAFLDIMRNEYRGRTAKFTGANGEVYYAKFDGADLRKNIFGDKKSSSRGWRAKINTGADGNIFELIENARYSGSSAEQGKHTAAHRGLTGWEYFVKTVQIDGKVYDLLANVRKKPEGEYVYSIQLDESRNEASALPLQYQNGTAKAENRPVRVPTDASEATIRESGGNVKARFSPETDSRGRTLTREQREYFRDSKATDSDGRLLTLFHQTENEFTVFNPRNKGAGAADSQTPSGIFMKPDAEDIGLRGKRQMPLYANIINPLTARNRESLTAWYRENIPEYREAEAKIREVDDTFQPEYEAAEARSDAWYEENYDAYSAGEISQEEAEAHITGELDEIMDRWKAADTEARQTAKKLLDNYFAESAYDGVHIQEDAGSFGRNVETWIAFQPSQVKDTANKAPTNDPDIRYSVEETDSAAEPERRRGAVDRLPAKARGYLDRAERKLTRKISEALSVPATARREYLQDIAREISEEFLNDGRISDETVSRLFERAYDEGVVADEEFYRQYRDLKDYLRTTPVTLSERDRADIADFEDFRKSGLGTLRLVKSGGTPADIMYEQLRGMAPELFGADATHPADQVRRMLEVGRSIARTEKSLDEYHGESAAEFRQWARRDFDCAICDMLGELNTVRRWSQERQAKKETPVIESTEQVMQLYGLLKDARKQSEKAAAKNLLTEHDEAVVHALLAGRLELGHLDPKTDNVRGITEVFRARQEYERLAGQLRQWNESRRARLRERADELLKNANEWKDKKAGILYSRETMERNIRDIVKDSAEAEALIREYFTPVHEAQAESTRLKNRMRERVRALGLSTRETPAMRKAGRVSEAHAVQLLGETTDNIRALEKNTRKMAQRDGKTLEEWRSAVKELWTMNPQLDRARIEGAVEEFRSIYDELFQSMNEARIRNGYEPVNYRSGYFPHFQPGDGDGIMGLFGKALGIKTDVAALPTSINGLTHTFRPGIQRFGSAQERLGFNTVYDAVEGFDRYIEGVADVIYQTDNIQRLRALAGQMRYRTGDEGLRKQIDGIRADTGLSEEDRQSRIDRVHENGRFTLSNFVVELEEYTNLLANKKSSVDRGTERLLGRSMYNVVKGLESRVAANMVAVNPASWLTNFIPLTQGGAALGRFDLLSGMTDTLRAYVNDDGFAGRSAFLTNRRGSDPLVRGWTEKASAAMGAPMEIIDRFTSDSLVRGRYRQNIRRGLSEAEAMREADAYVSGVMADRSKGSTPTLFESKNPLMKVFTQFQLEVNNQIGFYFKDLPRELKDKGLLVIARALARLVLGAWLYNEVYEFFVGRRPAADPLGMLNDAAGDLTGWKLPNLVEMGVGTLKGEKPEFRTEKKGAYTAAKGLASEAAEQVPFVGGLLGGGRLPINSALPDAGKLVRAAAGEGWSDEKRLAEAAKSLTGPAAYLLPPFGGGQVKKAYQGVRAVAKGGSYTVDAEGRDILQFPVFGGGGWETAKNYAQAAIFGKTSLAEGQKWVESGFDSLSAKETAAYQAMLEAEVRDRDAYGMIERMAGFDYKSDKFTALMSSDISDEGKGAAYYAMLAGDSEREALEALGEAAAQAAADRVSRYEEISGELAGLGSFFDSLDSKARHKALGNAWKLAGELALAAGSNEQYEPSASWMKWAAGGGDAGVSEAEAILFKVAYDMSSSDTDPETGKTVSGSKKENTLELAGELLPGLSDAELEYLMSGFWSF